MNTAIASLVKVLCGNWCRANQASNDIVSRMFVFSCARIYVVETYFKILLQVITYLRFHLLLFERRCWWAICSNARRTWFFCTGYPQVHCRSSRHIWVSQCFARFVFGFENVFLYRFSRNGLLWLSSLCHAGPTRREHLGLIRCRVPVGTFLFLYR